MAGKKKLSFEEALKHLEDSVKQLRSGSCSLEESINLYKDSIKYYELCSEILENAKQSIMIYNSKTGNTEAFNED